MKSSESKLVFLSIVVVVLSISTPTMAQWKAHSSKDEMTGKSFCYATSPTTGPKKKMGYPYGDVVAWLGVQTDGHIPQAFFGFNDAPNLKGGTKMDGYDLFYTRIRWDDNVEKVFLKKSWGSKFLVFQYSQKNVKKIISANTVLLELDWYGEGTVYFNFSLKGSSVAISKIRTDCGNR